LTWQTCPIHSIPSHFPSKPRCDHFLHVSRTYAIQVDDVEVITEGKPPEQGIKFKISKRRTSFFFGSSRCRLTWDDSDWESALETIEILTIGVSTLVELASVEIAIYKSAISLHLQPKTARSIELLKPFAAPQLVALEKSPLTAFATVVKWEGRRITIDGSAQIANGIFLKFERDFPGVMPIGESPCNLRQTRTGFLPYSE
jgi:hypothetical protein